MANRYHGNIITIDTTNTQVGGKKASSGPTGPLKIKALKWVSTQQSGIDIANDDDLGIKIPDANGSYFIEARAAVHETAASQDNKSCVYYSAEFGGKPWTIPSLYVEDLDGGELQIFLE